MTGVAKKALSLSQLLILLILSAKVYAAHFFDGLLTMRDRWLCRHYGLGIFT